MMDQDQQDLILKQVQDGAARGYLRLTGREIAKPRWQRSPGPRKSRVKKRRRRGRQQALDALMRERCYPWLGR